ncbi:MAG: ferritin family protein [Betaproteobacteria bacterium]|nr:ferritin family protein [Betaproteobacteria bacterium]
MSQINEKVVELVRLALSLELNGEHFYRHAATATEHPKGKEMFLRLAEQEKARRGEIGALFSAIVGEHEWQRICAEEDAHARRSDVVSQLEAAFMARGHAAVADDAQALRLALELERRTIHFYGEVEKHTSDAETLRALRELIDDERYHYDFLQGQLDSVQNVGVWLDGPEFRVDGKF